MKSLVLLALGLAALRAAPAVRAEEDKVKVDVVIDFGGDENQEKLPKKVVRPTPDKPAYYLPVFAGYKVFGYAEGVRAPPPARVERMLVAALAAQGYRLMTKQSPPSLVLGIWWGYMSPPKKIPGSLHPVESASVFTQALPPGNRGFGLGSSGVSPAFVQSIAVNQLAFEADYRIDRQMLSMVAGDTLKDYRRSGDDRQMVQARTLAREPFYYVLISALDFDSAAHHKRILIWQAHISTPMWGLSFDEALSPMIKSAAPLFGRETAEPQLVETPVTRKARVEMGEPVLQ